MAGNSECNSIAEVPSWYIVSCKMMEPVLMIEIIHLAFCAGCNVSNAAAVSHGWTESVGKSIVFLVISAIKLALEI